MDIQTAYSLYKSSVDIESESIKKQKYRIDRYISFVSPKTNAKDAMSSENLIAFFKTLEGGLNGFYYTIKTFYYFVLKDACGISQKDLKAFPIELPEGYSANRDVESKKGKDNYLEFDFNFEQLFQNEFYQHLQNNTATITLKAAFAIGLGAAYTTTHIKQMVLEDVVIEDENVKIRNKYNSDLVEYIVLKGKLASYVKDYYLYCKERVSNNTLLFMRHWSGYELNVNEDISGYTKKGGIYKPTEVISLANYLALYQNMFLTKDRIESILHCTPVKYVAYNTPGCA